MMSGGVRAGLCHPSAATRGRCRLRSGAPASPQLEPEAGARLYLIG